MFPRQPDDRTTIVDVLRMRAERQTNTPAYRFLDDGDGPGVVYSYSDLDLRARVIAAFLLERYTAGQRVLLLYQPGLEYISALFGCMYAGMIAVPALPLGLTKVSKPNTRLHTIVQDCGPVAALASSAWLRPALSALTGDPILGQMNWHVTDDLDAGWAARWSPVKLEPDQTAFLQYTSGSTTTPRGVMVSHYNVMHNEAIIRKACTHTEASTFVGWLPFYHDMGLIGNILQPLYLGSQSILLPPSAFLQKPICWLRAISDYKGETSGGPNFAYDYCVRRITPEERATLDLSNWTVAFNGSEPIRAETLESFAQTFAACGFERNALFPCYGLAEATLMVSASRRETPFVVRRFDAEKLQGGEAMPAVSEATVSKTLVSSGTFVDGLQVVIIGPKSRTACPARTIGEIWVSGGSVAKGYWNRPAETEETFCARRVDLLTRNYLRTGDLGFVSEENLFVTGRLKDLIIIRGRNFYPQDIELTAERCHPALRPSGTAAFAMAAGDEERLAIVSEVERAFTRQPLDEVLQSIRRAVVNDHELEPHVIVLIAAGRLLKTSSGKVRRSACREAFQAGELEPLAQLIVEEPDTAIGFDTSVANPPTHEGADTIANRIQEVIGNLIREKARLIDEHCRIGELGLDSLRVTQLRHGLERLFNRTFSSPVPFADLSIRDLVQLVQARLPELGMSQSLEGLQRPHRNRQAMSSGQRGIWLLHQIDPDNTAYNICRALSIRGKLDVETLRGALVMLYERHASLQSTFRISAESPVQEHKTNDSWIQFEDISSLGAPALSSRLQAESEHKFSFVNGPLFRVTVLKAATGKHVLILNMHHIVGDLWSMGILLRELLAIYSAGESQRPAQLDALPLDYSDYVHWQSDLLASAEGQNQADYWAARLSPPLEPLNLPYDRPHPASPTSCGATHQFEIAADLLLRANALALNTRTTVFSCLLAVFNLLLYRNTAQRDITVGVPCSGRSQPEFASIVGYFVNLAPVRVHLLETQTVTDLIKLVHAQVQESLAHQDYPFSSMIEKIPGLRKASGQPAINVLFVLQSFPQAELEALAPLTLGVPGGHLRVGPLELSTMSLRQAGSQFDLGLFLVEHERRLIGAIEYSASLFNAATIHRLAQSFCALLELALEAPNALIDEITQLTPAERLHLQAWNHTAVTYSEPATLAACIESVCRRAPEAKAVSDDLRSLSYSELNTSANRLARCIQGLGITPEAVVAVCLERSVDLEIVLLAILKAGAAYLPLDPADPESRQRMTLEDSGAALLITDQTLAGRFAARIPVLTIDKDIHAGSYDTGNLGVNSLDEQAVYVIYTSGSTGWPKGVVNTQGGIRNRLLWMQHYYALGDGDRVLQKTPYTFDVSVWEFFWPLIAGAEVVMARPDGHKDMGYILDALRARRITTVHFVPSQLRLLLKQPDLSGLSLRCIICSGEALDQELQEECLQRLPNVELHNLYGPTEAAIDVSAWHCVPGRPVAIGKPIANANTYVLDGMLNPLPAGVCGELFIGGAPIARGYLRRPDLTADRFVPHPLANRPGERLYRTGDRAWWTTDGLLMCSGRLDNQVKIRGARVELGEIEAALRRIGGIREAAVLFDQKQGAFGELTAYIACEFGDSKSWRASLREQLPEHMIPAKFFPVDELPLTPNGKRDVRKLLSMESISSFQSTPGALPRNPLEEQLVAIWAEVLNRRVGIHDNFFDLGGHSLLATQLVSRIRDSLHCDIPVALIFSSGATVEQLAEAIEEQLFQQAGESVTSALVSQVLAVSDEELRTILNGQ